MHAISDRLAPKTMQSAIGRFARARAHRIVSSAVLLAALAGTAACNTSPAAVPPEKPVAVTVVVAARRPVPVYGHYIGQTEAVKTVEIRARVEGYVERQVAADGAEVKAGDVLFVIDPKPFEVALNQTEAAVGRERATLRQAEAALVQRQADIAQAEANLARAVAQAENARTQERRYRALIDDGLIAREQYDQIRTNMAALDATVKAEEAAVGNMKASLAAASAAIENARAAVRAAEAAVESARLQLGYTVIRSPLDGRMGRAEVRVGALVGKGEPTLLATVSTQDPMYVNWSVSEREALEVWRRREAQMQARPGGFAINITLPDDTSYPQAGRLDFVDRAVDPRTGTLALRATFPNPQRVLQPGQYVRLRVLLEERRDAVVVPQAAIVESQGSASVLVVGPDRTVQPRTVKTGPRLGSLWAIDDGVKAGEMVITKGLHLARPGAKVEPTIDPLPAASTGPATAESTASGPGG